MKVNINLLEKWFHKPSDRLHLSVSWVHEIDDKTALKGETEVEIDPDIFTEITDWLSRKGAL